MGTATSGGATAGSVDWKIEPSQIAFKNVGWQTWLEDFVCSNVNGGLGISSKARPRCEFKGLVLSGVVPR